ncbi:MAG TPA: hypothetical protein VI588_02815 [Candidatus Gracilibacteria bacterium]|nr:hypothetical protein [Candidatus Gracilibacteria bacterium]
MESPAPFSRFPVVPVEKIKQVFYPYFRRWRDEFLDDLPPAIVSRDDVNYSRYKCRNNWFNAFQGMLCLTLSQVTDPLYTEIRDYLDHLKSEVDWDSMRTRGEIERANMILRKVAAYIENEM